MRNVYAKVLQTRILGENRPWQDWGGHRTARRRSYGDHNGRIAKNEVEVDFSRFTPDKYLFSWSTAVAGVEAEKDGHTIVTPHNKWINDNGNAWLNEVLLESYHSFILAENYLEHIQVPELSKGKILDAVAWVVHQQVGGYPEPIPTIFVDILVATNKKRHPKLCRNIMNGTIDTMSMGCLLPTGMVTLSDGTRREIQYIQEGDYILTGEGRVRRVKKVMVRSVENEPVYHTKVWGVREGIDLTGEHPLFSAFGFKKDVKDYQPSGLKLPHICGEPEEKFSFQRMDSWKGYKKTQNNRKNTGPRNLYLAETYPREIWLPSEMVDESLAELLGMIAGDGILGDWHTSTSTVVEVMINEEEIKISERARALLAKVCGNFKERGHHECDKVTRLQSYSSPAFEVLKKFLLGTTAPEKKFAAEVLFWPHHLQKALLRGFFNTDGDVSKKTQLKGESRSADLVDQIYLIVLRQGGLANKGSVLHKPTGFSKGKDPYRMYSVTVAKSYSDAWMSDKLPEGHQSSAYTRESFFAQNQVARPVREVSESLYTGLVYNLEVEEDHTYLHNGLVVHNCDILWSQCTKCGKFFEEGKDDPCRHISEQLGRYYTDREGRKRRIAELCGKPGVPGSCIFKECSWVRRPAFVWAKRHGFVEESGESTGKPLRAFVPKERLREAAKD